MKNPAIIIISLLVVANILSSGFAGARGKYEAAGISDSKAAENFFLHLQQAVRNNQRAKVAAMMSYPISVRVRSRKVKLRAKADLLKRYDFVFNKKVKHALAAQKIPDLFANWQGIMIGNGELWFNQMPVSHNFKITAINN